MSHFAKLDENNKVVEVIVVNNEVITDENGNENEQLGIDFCVQLFGNDTKWVQTSYNGTFRKRYPAFGDTYNEELDAFIIPKPYSSWILNSDTCDWEAPIPKPEVSQDQISVWNESNIEWKIINKKLPINKIN
jgi:hypothetical protein